ncbi:MAG: metalloregulator ArsR/SmtB family transcription factor [Thermoanaerobaculia bacterium]
MTQTCSDGANSKRSFCCDALRELLSPDLFRALADPNRLTVLIDLAGKSAPSTVSDIAPCCQVDYSVVSRHLATLRRAGIVQAEKRGREVYYTLRYSQLSQALRSIADAIDTCCAEFDQCQPETELKSQLNT